MKPAVWIMTLVFSAVLWSCDKPGTDWPQPVVVVMPNDGCNSIGEKSDHLPSDQSCLYVNYLNDSILEIRHMNAGFNCCPEAIVVDCELRGDTLFIFESETGGVCDCNCLYDVDYYIMNIPPGDYIISVDEHLVREDDSKIEFQISLPNFNQLDNCVQRRYYPWGGG